MKHPHLLLLTPVLLLLIAAILLIAAPGIAVRPLLTFALASQGVSLLRLDDPRIGFEQFTASRAEFEASGVVLRGENLLISFKSEEGFAVSVDEIHLDALDIDLAINEESEPATNPIDLLNQVRSLPANNIQVEQYRVNSDSWSVAGELTLRPGPMEVTTSARWTSLPGIEIHFSSNSAEDASLNTLLEIRQSANGQINELASVSGSLILTDNVLLANADFRIGLQRLFDSGLLPAWNEEWTSAQNQVNGLVEFSAATQNDVMRLRSASVELTHPDREVRFTRNRDDINSRNHDSVSISMPFNLSAEIDASEGFIRVLVPTLSASLHSEAIETGIITTDININTRLTEASLVCRSSGQCSGSTELNIYSPDSFFSGITANNATLQSEIRFEISPEGIIGTAPTVQLRAPSILADGLLANTDIGLQDFAIEWHENLTAGARLITRDSELTVNDVALVEPELSGEFQLSNSLLSGTAAFGLAGERLIVSEYSHDFSSGLGSATTSMDGLTLTESRPISHYVLQGIIAADVVAGAVSANASLSWRFDADQPLAISGPVDLTLEDASGYLQETLLVGVNTSLRAQLMGNFRVLSDPIQIIEIRSVDIGMPLADLSWRYQFDTAAGTFEILNAKADLLGGQVSIADFVYDQNIPSQQMTVVLSGIDLETMIALADYPELFVDGFVSGYIPLTLKDSKLQVEEGLVAALNPGGTIRYDSPTTSVSDNSSVQLVNDALSNYRYKTMDTRVFYDSNGDLRLEVQLAGVNPDMNGGQAINLNVNITDNIPTLLRSLYAGRAISERLEEYLQVR